MGMDRWGCFYCEASFLRMQECEDHEQAEHWGEHVVVNFIRLARVRVKVS